MTPPSLSRLRLYLDTADVTAWQTWFATGLLYGVTTNPTLLERAQQTCSIDNLTRLAHHAFALGAQEMQVQTWGPQLEKLVTTGMELAAIDERIVVKVPVTRTGTEAAARLVAAGVRITLTAVYLPHQALMAAALGAEYAAPYLGRINDMGRTGRVDLVTMQQILKGVDSPLRLLVASIRELDDITYLAAQGLDTFTFSAAIATALFTVPATDQAAATFEQAAQRMAPT